MKTLITVLFAVALVTSCTEDSEPTPFKPGSEGEPGMAYTAYCTNSINAIINEYNTTNDHATMASLVRVYVNRCNNYDNPDFQAIIEEYR